MPDIVIRRFRDRATITGDSKDGCKWLVVNTEVPVSLTVQLELIEDFKSSLEADGLSVEVI